MNTESFIASSLNTYRQEDLHRTAVNTRQNRVSVGSGRQSPETPVASTFSALRSRFSNVLRRGYRSSPLTAGS